MPIYEYRCGGCSQTFEILVRNDTVVACPSCASKRVERLMSVPSLPQGGAGATKLDVSRLGPPPGGCHGGGCGCH